MLKDLPGEGGVLAWSTRSGAFSSTDPRTGERVAVEQAVRVPRADEWTPRCGPAEVLCWGVLRSGLLRHPLFVAWRAA